MDESYSDFLDYIHKFYLPEKSLNINKTLSVSQGAHPLGQPFIIEGSVNVALIVGRDVAVHYYSVSDSIPNSAGGTWISKPPLAISKLGKMMLKAGAGKQVTFIISLVEGVDKEKFEKLLFSVADYSILFKRLRSDEEDDKTITLKSRHLLSNVVAAQAYVLALYSVNKSAIEDIDWF